MIHTKDDHLLSLILTPMKRIHAYTFNQVVQINGILGYVYFIGEDVTILVDAENKQHIIENRTIKEVYSKDIVRDRDDSVYYI